MENPNLYTLFVDALRNIYNAETQIIKVMPNFIRLASLPELKEALSHHLQETEEQIVRLEYLFTLIGIPAEQTACEGMEGILVEGAHVVFDKTKSPSLDAAIISACQKVEHYEIASYGSLRSFARHLELSSEIIDLLQQNLDEEGSADKKLTKIADGSFFTSGVNHLAAVESSV